FFFSSRRRHTRSYGDWSSDVCSSDLRSQRRGISLFLPDSAQCCRQEGLPRWKFRRLPMRSTLSMSLRGRQSNPMWLGLSRQPEEIGRASCREVVWIQEVELRCVAKTV